MAAVDSNGNITARTPGTAVITVTTRSGNYKVICTVTVLRASYSWYADAVTWAAAQGIVGGYGNGRFGPNDSITREQLAVMLWRYNKEPAATDKELHFSDADRASSWALDALRWAAENGILNGKGNGILDPAGLTSRAEAAQMFENLLNK